MLEELGASALEDSVYQYLISVPSARATVVADVLGVSASDVQAALSMLESRGFVSRSTGRPPRYLAAPPNMAVARLVRDRQESLQRLLADLDRAEQVYRLAAASRSVGELIEIIADPMAIRARVDRIFEQAQKEYLGLTRPPFHLLSLQESTEVLVTTPDSRVVYDASILDLPEALDALRVGMGPGDKNRLHPDVPLKLMIFDREVAVLPVGHAQQGPPAMMIVHRCSLLDALVGFFESVWAQATPLHLDVPYAAETGMPAEDRQLLSLMLAGLTDQAMASQLGIGHRSVQRRVHQLMEQVGARTRFQLGWHAANHGWLDTGAHPAAAPGNGSPPDRA